MVDSNDSDWQSAIYQASQRLRSVVVELKIRDLQSKKGRTLQLGRSGPTFTIKGVAAVQDSNGIYARALLLLENQNDHSLELCFTFYKKSKTGWRLGRAAKGYSAFVNMYPGTLPKLLKKARRNSDFKPVKEKIRFFTTGRE